MSKTKSVKYGSCYCSELPEGLRYYFSCNSCINAVLTDKNLLVQDFWKEIKSELDKQGVYNKKE